MILIFQPGKEVKISNCETCKCSMNKLVCDRSKCEVTTGPHSTPSPPEVRKTTFHFLSLIWF